MYAYEQDWDTACVNRDSRTWGMACHISALVGSLCLPSLGHLVGPLVVWLLKKDRDPFADDQGRESLNFQISMTIYGLVLAALVFISAILSAILIGLPFLIVFAVMAGVLWIVDMILVIVAAVQAYNGVVYRYPATLRFL